MNESQSQEEMNKVKGLETVIRKIFRFRKKEEEDWMSYHARKSGHMRNLCKILTSPFLPVMRPARYGQLRGKSWMTQVLGPVQHCTQYFLGDACHGGAAKVRVAWRRIPPTRQDGNTCGVWF